MNKRKIAIITGSRADYGLLYHIIKMIRDDTDLALQLVVTGMHLNKKFGLTITQIKADGFQIAGEVKIPLSSDTEESTARAMGQGMIGFAEIYKRLRPDIILVLGDRFEIHAAVSAAVPFKIPVAHIHGGEATEGVFDEQLRNSITKMSHIHFASTEAYRKRIIQMGERPEYVFCFGCPGIDNIFKLNLLNQKSLFKELGIPNDRKIGIITYHPVTLEADTGELQISQLLRAIKEIKGIFWIFTSTNADTGGKVILKKIKNFVKTNPKESKFFASLGQRNYLSVLKNATLMVGNSSSAVIEAPSFGLPAVDIGDRQKGRIKTVNVIEVEKYDKESILNAVRKAASSEFRQSLKGLKNPYGNGNVSEKIVDTLKKITLDKKLIKKRFYELENSHN